MRDDEHLGAVGEVGVGFEEGAAQPDVHDLGRHRVGSVLEGDGQLDRDTGQAWFHRGVTTFLTVGGARGLEF